MENLYIGRGKDEDNAALLAFLDEAFFADDEAGTGFLELLPKIYKDKYRPAYNNFVIRSANGAFLAAAGNFDNGMAVGGVELKTCCIGNVAVGRDFRRRGYMVELMNVSIADMIRRGIDLSYLGGQRQRYGYFGYENAGVSYFFHVSRQSYKHAVGGAESGLTLEPLSADDTDALRLINGIYTKAPAFSRRAEDALYDVLCSWHESPYLLRENGNIVGYAMLNGDKDYVPEFGLTDPALLPRFLAALFENTEKDGVGVNAAPYETEKLAFFTKCTSWMCVDHSESILVLNFQKVLTAYLQAAAAYTTLCDGELTVLIHGKAGDERLKLAVKNNRPSVAPFDGDAEFELDCLGAVRAFFSNFPLDRAPFPPAVRQWFPLPLYFSSRDTM